MPTAIKRRNLVELKRRYTTHKGYHLKKSDAQVVGEFVESLEMRNADTLWRKAKEATGRIHELFEWDVQKSAEDSWHRRALWLMNAVDILETLADGKEVQSRAFISFSPETLEEFASHIGAPEEERVREEIGRLGGEVRDRPGQHLFFAIDQIRAIPDLTAVHLEEFKRAAAAFSQRWEREREAFCQVDQRVGRVFDAIDGLGDTDE